MMTASPAIGIQWWAGSALAVTLLAGCSMVPVSEDAAQPAAPGTARVRYNDPSLPLSRYGNPDSYVVFGNRYHVLATRRGYIERGIASWYGQKFQGRRTSSGEPYDMYALTAAHKTLPLPSYVRVTNLRNARSVTLRVNDRGPFRKNRLIDLSYAAALKLGIASRGTGLVEVQTVDPPAAAAAADPSGPSNTTAVTAAEPGRRHAQGSPPAAANPGSAATATDERADVAAGTVAPAMPTPTATQGAAAATRSDPNLFIQVGAFAERDNAEQLRAKLSLLDMGQIVILPAADSPNEGTAGQVGRQALYRVRIGPLTSVTKADDAAARLESAGLTNYQVVVKQ